MKKIYWILLWTLLAFHTQAQTKSPQEFLGYELGQRFTPHHLIVAYFEHVASHNKNVVLKHYGKTYEQRPLVAVFVSSPSNIQQLDQIQEDNLKRTGLKEGQPGTQIPITWLSYNVHGNEAVSSEAAMVTLWSMVDPAQTRPMAWLQSNLVVIDPCLNPDGRDRYVMWYNQKMNAQMQPDPQSVEHLEPWPGGRANHYLFDLNRDWAWQTQIESQQRMALYQQWMPQMHLDFHEQEINSPYYFAPAASPVHHQLSEFQHEFQETFGKNTAGYFDEQNWFYFTKERFDLLYPSYGDTWPMYNGAIGMTIEQGGSGKAGIGVFKAEGDTLTLKDRIAHHHTTALSAIEVTATHAKMVVDQFEKYHKENRENPRGKYKSFIIKGDNPSARIAGLLGLLDKNQILYKRSGKSKKLQGFDYQSGKNTSFSLDEEDIVINAYQPKSVLTQVLFEPAPHLQDSVTYDITSWALPYAHGLKAYAVESRVDGEQIYEKQGFQPNQAIEKTLAYMAPWNASTHAQFLAALLQKDIRVRFAEYDFEVGGKAYERGTLIITRGGNQHVDNFHQKIAEVADSYEIKLGQATTGYVDKGKDFGSSHVRTIKSPRVALVGGDGTSSLNFGEIWHFFEQELHYPLSILETSQWEKVDLRGYDVVILPSGQYGDWDKAERQQLQEWVKSGGKLIAIDGALELFADQEGFGLATYENKEEKAAQEKADKELAKIESTAPYQELERLEISNYAPGAVFEVKMDDTYALGFGTAGAFFTLKNNSNRYAYLSTGINAGIIPSADYHRAGFIGYRIKEKMDSALVFGVEEQGKGQLIYMVDNPLFRSFWENGKLIMANAVFLVGQ